MNFTLKRGEQHNAPYTPGSDVKAGDYVVLNAGTGAGLKGGVAVRDCKANEQGSVDISSGSATYLCKVDGAYSVGAALYSDGSDTLTSSGNLFGFAAEASSQAGDTIEVSLDTRISPTAV